MLNINFVPEDYVQNNESHRINLMYLVLFLIVMSTLGGSFVTIKMRQRALHVKEKIVNKKMAEAKESIEQFEELQTKRKAMMKTALTTAELLEPVPRSVLLASLTNNLPEGMSLLRLDLVQKESVKISRSATTNKYKSLKSKEAASAQPKVSPEQLLETHIDIEGIAPSDLQVAAYIERLDTSALLSKVALVESKEHKIEETTFRQFKLKAMLKKDVHLTKDDIGKIRSEVKLGSM